MALSAVKTWLAGEVLTAADLNAEFANGYNNGQSFGNPWIAHQAAGGFDLTGLDEVALDDGEAAASAAGRLRRNGSALAWHDGTQSAALLTDRSATMAGTVGMVPAEVSGTPAQHGLYRENVLKGWVVCDYAGTILDSFNVSSITDVSPGNTTVTWDRDFASVNYAVTAEVESVTHLLTTHAIKAVGSVSMRTWTTSGNPSDATSLSVMAIGDQ